MAKVHSYTDFPFKVQWSIFNNYVYPEWGKVEIKGYEQAVLVFSHLLFFLPLSFYSFEFCIMIKLAEDQLHFKATENPELMKLGSVPHSQWHFYSFEQPQTGETPAPVGVRRIQGIDAQTIISKLHFWFLQKNPPTFSAVVHEQLLILHWVELVEVDPRSWLLLLSEHVESQNTLVSSKGGAPLKVIHGNGRTLL